MAAYLISAGAVGTRHHRWKGEKESRGGAGTGVENWMASTAVPPRNGRPKNHVLRKAKTPECSLAFQI